MTGRYQFLYENIVQAKLDEIVEESQRHNARKQKNILLLSGGRRIDFYKNLEDDGGKGQISFYSERRKLILCSSKVVAEGWVGRILGDGCLLHREVHHANKLMTY